MSREHIDKVYGLCVNAERRKNLEKYEKLLSLEIDTSFSENAWDKNLEFYKNKNLISLDWPHGLGAAGCTISFQNIFEDIVKNKYKYSLIFEDDINWNKEFYGDCTKEKFDQILRRIKFDGSWDIFYLGTENQGKISNQEKVDENIYILQSGKINKNVIAPTSKSMNESLKSVTVNHKNFGGQQAFVISLEGAKGVLKNHNPASVISDGLMCYSICNGDVKNPHAFIPTLFTQLSHPRISKYENRLWTSMTKQPSEQYPGWGNPTEKYKDDFNKDERKGISAYPLSEKYEDIYWPWKKMDIYVDIDHTICTYGEKTLQYHKAIPIFSRIKKINKLYDEGHNIVYWTARGTKTGLDWRKVTEKQFKEWGVKYHELRFGKPAYDLFIDDKNINSEAFFK